MSELSDQIDEALTKLGADAPDTWVNTEKEKWIAETPGYKGFSTHNAMQVVAVLRRIYRKEAGRTPAENPQDALDRTESACNTHLLPLCRAAFADGVQVGHGISHSVKKYSFFKKIDEIFDNDGFREESDLFQISIQMDYEACESIERYFKAAAVCIAGASGFLAISEKQNLNRVWDLWALSCNSASTGLFLAGVMIGKEWREKDTLTGIMAATENGGSDD